MVNDSPLLFTKFQRLGALDLSILEHLKIDCSILVKDSWWLKLFDINFGHLAINLNSPLLESFVVLEHGDHSADSLESLLCGNKLVLLELSHLSLVLGEVYW